MASLLIFSTFFLVSAVLKLQDEIQISEPLVSNVTSIIKGVYHSAAC